MMYVNNIKKYDFELNKLKIQCVKEHILSFLTGFDDTVDIQIEKYIKYSPKIINYDVLRLIVMLSKLTYSN